MSEETKLILGEIANLREDIVEVKRNVAGLKWDVAELKKDVVGLKGDVTELKEDVVGLKGDVAGLQKDVVGIHLTLENETNKNISVIAEGHLDLRRKLDEALKIEQEKEMLFIRMNRVENEVRCLRDRVEAMA